MDKTSAGTENYAYDVALSYASENRNYVEEVANLLEVHNVTFFYDQYEKHTLWGEDLYKYLSEVYQKKARYCVMFISKYYAEKVWTKHEMAAAQARALNDRGAFILPIRLDDTEIPGMLPTVAYLSWPPENAESIVNSIIAKLASHWKNLSDCLKEGNYQSKAKNYKKAIAAYDYALRKDPKCVEAYIGKGKALYYSQRYQEAAKVYERVTNISNHFSVHENDDPFIWLADIISYHLGNIQEAIQVMDRALKHNEGNKAAYFFFKGRLLRKIGLNNEAIGVYNEAIESCDNVLFEEICQEYITEKADLLEHMQLYDQALEAYDLAISASSADTFASAGTRYRKTKLLIVLERYEEALRCCDQILRNHIDVYSGNSHVYTMKGDILFNLELYEDAIIAYDEAIRLRNIYVNWDKEGDSVIYIKKANIFDILDMKAEANKMRRKAIQIRKAINQKKFADLED